MEREQKFKSVGPWLMVMASAGAVIVWLLTKNWGIGLSAAGVHYLQVAQQLAFGQGVVAFANDGTLKAATQYPPFFSFLLSWSWFLGMDALQWARGLSGFLFGFNVFLAGTLAWVWSRDRRVSLMAAGLFLVSVHLLESHVILLAEPLFILFMMIFFIALKRYEDKGEKGMIYALALAATLAALTRHAGWALIMTGSIVLWRIEGKQKAAVFFLLLAAALPLLWLVRSVLLGAEGAWLMHGLMQQRVYGLINSSSEWLLPARVFEVVRWAFLGLALGGAIGLLRRVQKSAGAGFLKYKSAFNVIGIFLGVFFAGYVVALALGRNDLEINQRTLVPVYIMIIVGVLPGMILSSDRGRMARILVGCVVLLGVLSLARSAQLGSAMWRHGYDYASKAFKDSKVTGELRALDDRVTVYTNDPAAMYSLAHRPSVRIPAKGAPDRFFPALPSVAAKFAAHEAVAVIFQEKTFDPGRKWIELQKMAGLQSVASDKVVTIYVQKKESKVETPSR